MNMLSNPDRLLEKVGALHDRLQARLHADLVAQEEAMLERTLDGVADVRGGDTIYAIDVHAEEIIDAFCEEWAGEDGPFALIAEGIEDAGWKVFPHGAREEDARFLMMVDPIDGTRNLMFNKRPAWALTGIAPNRGRATTLADIEVAVMTELPTTRNLFADRLWAIRGSGAHRRTRNLVDGTWKTLPIRPSKSETLAHGFSALVKFFPPAKAATAALEEQLYARVAPEDGENPVVFDDQYMTTGGQLYELMVGHDRFLADLRPVFVAALGLPPKLVCHPYDICVELIAREAGVPVVDEWGAPLSAPLDIRAPVAWVGYANAALRARIEPHLLDLLSGLPEHRADSRE
ncbi:MAG: inositol monophosphatase [Armatimonadota bacterium]